MAISISIDNKMRRYADEKKKKKTEADSNLAKIVEGDSEIKTDDKAITKTAEISDDDSVVTKKLEEIGVNYKTNNPLAELEKIDSYYGKKKEETQKVNEELSEPAKENGYQKIDVPNETIDDITERVKSSLDAKYGELKQKNIEKTENSVLAKEESKKDLQENYKKATDEINYAYDEATEKVSGDAIKRGLARSSIVVLQLSGLEQNRAKDLSEKAISLADQISKFDNEIETLKADQENAFSMFDLDYASELQQKIKEEQDSLFKKQKEAIELNNEVTKLENTYNLNKEKQDVELKIDKAEANKKYGQIFEEETKKPETQSIDDMTYEERTAKVKFITDYLSKLSRKDALNKLNSDAMFAYYLGDAWEKVYYIQYMRPLD